MTGVDLTMNTVTRIPHIVIVPRAIHEIVQTSLNDPIIDDCTLGFLKSLAMPLGTNLHPRTVSTHERTIPKVARKNGQEVSDGPGRRKDDLPDFPQQPELLKDVLRDRPTIPTNGSVDVEDHW